VQAVAECEQQDISGVQAPSGSAPAVQSPCEALDPSRPTPRQQELDMFARSGADEVA
jgi:hypothetical protein